MILSPPEMDSPVEPAAVETNLTSNSCSGGASLEEAFACPRNYLENRFVYVVVSPRAEGLSIGVNLNPDKFCNFDCVYCEIDRERGGGAAQVNMAVLAEELSTTLAEAYSGSLRNRTCYQGLPADLLVPRHVALSGDGEPTQSEYFLEAVETVTHQRALGEFPFFKMVLITNSSGLDLPLVQRGVGCFTSHDEVWAKLDAGTQEWMDRVNHTSERLDRIVANIHSLARERPVIVQTLFPMIGEIGPLDGEIAAYSERLREITDGGGRIDSVQIYSANRPTPHSECGHLPLRRLSEIAQQVRRATGLRVEVF